jgi:hypothetical protein
MAVKIKCPACARENRVESSLVGQKITCSGCGKALRVAAPREKAAENTAAETLVKFACPACGRKFQTKAELAGKKIRCTGCGAGVRVPTPAPEATARAAPSQPASKTDEGKSGTAAAPERGGVELTDWESDVGEGYALAPDEEVVSSEQVKTPNRTEAVLPSRSAAMQQVRQEADKQQAVETQEQAAEAKKKKKKKKKKGSGYSNSRDTLILVGCAGALVALLAGLAWAFPHFRFPLGALLCVIGFIVYLLGWAAMKQLVAEEGTFKLLLFRFFPPYQLWFVATHWGETKDFVAFFGAGLLILTLGGFVLKLAPMTKEERESAARYEKLQKGRQAEAPPALPAGIGGDEE